MFAGSTAMVAAGTTADDVKVLGCMISYGQSSSTMRLDSIARRITPHGLVAVAADSMPRKAVCESWTID